VVSGRLSVQALTERGLQYAADLSLSVGILSVLLVSQVVKDIAAIEYGDVVQLVLDAQQLVVFADSIGTTQGTSFDLAGIGGNRQVGDSRILGFAAAM